MLTKIKQENKQLWFQICALRNTKTYVIRLTYAHI